MTEFEMIVKALTDSGYSVEDAEVMANAVISE